MLPAGPAEREAKDFSQISCLLSVPSGEKQL